MQGLRKWISRRKNSQNANYDEVAQAFVIRSLAMQAHSALNLIK